LEEIKMSPQMSVYLYGDEAFKIKKLFTDAKQAIVGNYAHWEWDVTPLTYGVHNLILHIDAIIEIPNYTDRSVRFPVIEREIKIKVNYNYETMKFLKNNAGKIIALSGAIIALFGLLWKKP
jgi:hypothetical protein